MTTASTAPQRANQRTSSLARSTLVMSMGTVLSRLTGVIRLGAIVAALGVAETRLTDSYNLANTVPNIIYELVLGGVVTSVFVPLFVELLAKEDRDRAWEIMSAILNVSLLALSAIALIGVLAAPWIAGFYAGRLEGSDFALQQRVVEFLLRLLIPQVVLYGIYFIVAGIINAHKRFGAPMWTPILNNVIAIAVFVAFAQMYGNVTLRTVTTEQLLLIGLGTTASVAPMGLALVPLLRRLGRYRFTLSLKHPSVRKLGKLSGYVIGFVVANQLGYLVIQWLANGQQGGYSAYISASTFFLMPIGLFVWSLTTALMPEMSEHAVNQRWESFRERFSTGLRATLFLMLPATVGYLVLGRLVVELLLEHGVMTARSTDLVTGVLRVMLLGLVQFSIFQLLVRAFYAMQDTRTPFLVNAGVVAVNMAVNVPMFVWFGVEGLAAGQAVAYTFGVLIALRLLSRRVGGVGARRIASSAARMTAAAAGMALLVWLALAAGKLLLTSETLFAQGVLLAGAVGIGTVSYLGLAMLLGVEELNAVRSLLLRRKDGRAIPAASEPS